MSDVKMNDEDVLYCLQNLAGYESCDIIDDTVEIAVNDDQFGEMSIVRTAQLGVELIEKQAEQIKVLRDALSKVCDVNHTHGGSIGVCGSFYYKVSEDVFKSCDKALEATKD